MTKRAAGAMLPFLAASGSGEAPLYRQLYQRIRGAILQGTLRPGVRLPSSRVLAGDLGVSRDTVELAFERPQSPPLITGGSVTATAAFSFVSEYPAAAPGDAQRHFLAKLSVETDPADLQLDLQRCPDTVLVVDARSAKDYAEGHIPGSISLPHRGIAAATTAALPRDRILVTYCWGPSCNASTKAAARLAGLGFRVKELIGGIEYWRKEGYAVETGAA